MPQKKYLLFPLLVLLSTALWAQEKPAEVTTNWMELNKPGEAHRKLDALVGDWKTTTSIWMGGPDAPPTVFEGKASFEWILGGRFLEERTQAMWTFPGEDGKPVEFSFEGRGVTGYDNIRKMYVNSWMDNMTTYIAFNKGQFSADGKTFTMYGEMDEPAQGVFGRMVRIQTVIESENRHTFTMYDLHAGENYRVMQILYERL